MGTFFPEGVSVMDSTKMLDKRRSDGEQNTRLGTDRITEISSWHVYLLIVSACTLWPTLAPGCSTMRSLRE